MSIVFSTFFSYNLYFIDFSSMVIIHEGTGITLYIYFQLFTTVPSTSCVTYNALSSLSLLLFFSLLLHSLPQHEWP